MPDRAIEAEMGKDACVKLELVDGETAAVRSARAALANAMAEEMILGEELERSLEHLNHLQAKSSKPSRRRKK